MLEFLLCYMYRVVRKNPGLLSSAMTLLILKYKESKNITVKQIYLRIRKL